MQAVWDSIITLSKLSNETQPAAAPGSNTGITASPVAAGFEESPVHHPLCDCSTNPPGQFSTVTTFKKRQLKVLALDNKGWKAVLLSKESNPNRTSEITPGAPFNHSSKETQGDLQTHPTMCHCMKVVSSSSWKGLVAPSIGEPRLN